MDAAHVPDLPVGAGGAAGGSDERRADPRRKLLAPDALPRPPDDEADHPDRAHHPRDRGVQDLRPDLPDDAGRARRGDDEHLDLPLRRDGAEHALGLRELRRDHRAHLRQHRRLLGHPADRAGPGGDARGAHRRRRGRGGPRSGSRKRSRRRRGSEWPPSRQPSSRTTPTSARHERNRLKPVARIARSSSSGPPLPSRSTGWSRCRSSRWRSGTRPARSTGGPRTRRSTTTRTSSAWARARRSPFATRALTLRDPVPQELGHRRGGRHRARAGRRHLHRLRHRPLPSRRQDAAVPDPPVTHVPADRDHHPAAVHVGAARPLEHAPGV